LLGVLAPVGARGLAAQVSKAMRIISHVPEVQERFDAQVCVEKVGVGRSRVVVVSP
jgi:DNA repair exonuclease SbcCD ATPase subunit